MRAVKYVGRWAEVEIEVAPERWRRVRRGETIEVADRIAERLCEQPRNWVDPDAPADAPADTAPEGTIADVLAWVGTDPVRAAAALAAERDGKGRKKLLDQLEQLVTDRGGVGDVIDNGAERQEENPDG